jgi:hypothetical protein
MDKLEYAEKSADELMDFHLQDMELLNKEAHTTFTVIIAAIAGLFGYGLNIYDKVAEGSGAHAPLLWAIATSLLHLIIIGCVAVMETLMARAVMPKGNEPTNLMGEHLDKYTVEQIREVECLNLQARIDANQARNQKMGKCLNNLRLALVATPLIFGVALGVAVAAA